MSITLQSLKNNKGAKRKKFRVGRGEGSGNGKTSGRGSKGQMARAGRNHKPAFEGGQMRLIRRIPKRGFNHERSFILASVNISDLVGIEEGSEVTLDTLVGLGLVSGKYDGVKILGDGTMPVKLVIKAQSFSANAKLKIESVGGQCIVVPNK